MASVTDTASSPLLLHEERDAERQVVVHPADNDRFVVTGRAAIEACKLGISLQVWIEELNTMLGHVREWCGERSARVQGCVVSARSANVLLFFVPKSLAFDFDLAEEIAILNGEVVRRFCVGRVEMFQIPEREMDSFTPEDARRYIYGGP